MFQEFCEERWQQHVNMLEQSPRLNWAMLQKVKSTLHKDLVLYNEGHHPNHILCFCPRFSFVGFVTWDDRLPEPGWLCWMKSQHISPDGIPGVSANQHHFCQPTEAKLKGRRFSAPPSSVTR